MNNTLKILQLKYAINLFDWCSFSNNKTKEEKDSRVLILGNCDENLVRPLSKRVKEIYVCCSDKEYIDQFSYVSFIDNVFIVEKTLSDLKIDDLKQKFDFILIPSLTKDIFDIKDKKLEDIIKELVDKLSDDGSLYVAFDNSLSFDIIEGEKLDINEITFTYEDLMKAKYDLYDKYKGSEFLLYFPMPEYKFPLRIYSERYLPSLDDENQRTRNLVSLGKFKEYANSYIVIFNKVARKDSPIYVKYNIDRIKKYALRTSIMENEKDERYVVKKALSKEANEHIESLEEKTYYYENKNCKIIKPLKCIKEKDAKDGLSSIIFPYVDGTSLSNIILEKIKSNVREVDVLDFYMDKMIGKNSDLVDHYNLDCLFSNALVKDNDIYIIDCEWVDRGTTELNFLRYRILKYYYNSYKQYSSYKTFRDLLNAFYINKDDANRYEDAENEFQKAIHYNINDLDTNRYYEEKKDMSRYYIVKSEYDLMKQELESLKNNDYVIDQTTRQLNDTIRLQSVRIDDLLVIIDNKEKEITEVGKLATYYHSREALISKVLRNVKKYFVTHLKDDSLTKNILKYIYRFLRHPKKMFKMVLSKDGRNRIYGDFKIGDVYFECGFINLKKCERPKVSIIIPCYNQIKWTYKCLYSIVKNTDFEKVPYEIIIADDNSTDQTKNIKKFVENIIVARNETNLGFLKNCNNAAKIARGDYIFFLNNDTEIKENAIKSLVDLIESDFTVGMVGSKLIFADGKLQEAGGIIWADGMGANFGRGDDPKKPEYNYVREVDYISGAAIMIKKSLWEEIGGFDERYAPAYCEDSDLAFEVRKRGMKVLYQPRSEVIHYEGISNGKDENDKNSIKSYQVENNKKLKEKWEDVLINHFPNKDKPNFYKARERNFDKKTILIIDHYVPTWDKDAGSRTTFSYIKMFLNKGYLVKFLGDSMELNSPYGDILQDMGVEVLYGNDIRVNVYNYLKENKRNIDFVYMNRPHITAKYIDFIKENMFCKIIYYGHDLHYLRLLREYELTKNENSLYDSRYFKNLEYAIMKKAFVSYYPSEAEINEIHKVDENLNVKVINAYIFDKVDLSKRDFSNTKDLLFVGGFSHKPNEDALLWFDKKIFPLIKEKIPEINLNIVGSNATKEIKDLCKKSGYNYFGYVSDEELEELYKKSRIVIAPLRYGAGIKGKIIEAMAKGSVVITTTCGAEGINNAENFMIVKDTASEFANAILKIYNDFDELHKFSYYARKEINNNFTEDKAFEKIKNDFTIGE